ncbi:MAG: hypothetical protein RLZZ241_2144 [Bacteroidota bacterium]
MRNRIVLFFLGIAAGINLLGCEEPFTTNNPIHIKTYAVGELEFPRHETIIKASARTLFIENFFLPWRFQNEIALTLLDTVPGKDLSFLQQYLDDDSWYGENKKPHKRLLREEVVQNVDTTTFPNFIKKGIVIAHTNLRRIPSDRPGFDTYSKAGEGFPFDYFQETNLWANTPVQLLHLTKDKQWCYVLSPYYKGWVPMHDLALVSDAFIKVWCNSDYAIPVSDQVALTDPNSNYGIRGKIGMVLPYEATKNPNLVTVYYANADENQNAHLLKANIEIAQIATDGFAFDGANLKQLITQLEGRPYGWGGNLENRDCSSMIRDLMSPFKVWLPRDSGDQVYVGKYFELRGSLEEKLEVIKKQGIPFRTILRKKGHNMLYVGKDEHGEPLIFHAAWGLKTTYANSRLSQFMEDYPIEGLTQHPDGTITGRNIIGEAVITSVLAGSGNNGITAPMLEDIYAMTVFLED